MKVSKDDMKQIMLSGIGGAVLFSGLSFLRSISQKKICMDLHIDVPILKQHDPTLATLLGEISRLFYSIEPIVVNRIVWKANLLISLRLEKHFDLHDKIECKEQAKKTYEIYKESVAKLIERKETNHIKSMFAKIHTHIQSHMDAIMAQNMPKID